jgi:hypothetical protein
MVLHIIILISHKNQENGLIGEILSIESLSL